MADGWRRMNREDWEDLVGVLSRYSGLSYMIFAFGFFLRTALLGPRHRKVIEGVEYGIAMSHAVETEHETSVLYLFFL